MSTASGSPTRMKTSSVTAMSTALLLSWQFLASCCTNSTASSSAPRPCVVLRMDLDQGRQRTEGSLEEGGGWQWESARAQGSITVTQGCTLTVWTEQGGYKTLPSGTQVHLKGWEWTWQPLAFHCSCEKEDNEYENFRKKHVDPKVTKGNNAYCNEMMKEVNEIEQTRCKPVNTFIHAPIRKVKQVCSIRSGTATSPKPFNLTECRSRHPCHYNARNFSKKITVICRNYKPVHFIGTKD